MLPDGCMDLIWRNAALLVAGPDTRARLTADPAGTSYVGLRLPPGMGPAVFGVPAVELRDARVDLGALWPAAAARRVTERAEEEPRDVAAALEAVAVARLAAAGGPDRLAAALARELAGGHSVAEVARGVGLSERQLHRRSLELFGYGPKTLARVLRLQRALRVADSGGVPGPLAEIAAEAGYADQAHFAREVRALAGVPFTRLRRA